MKTISASEAATLCRDSALIHVLPEEHFNSERLPGAQNVCVYETAFLSKVAESVPDKAAPVIVYGAGGESLDSTVAVEKLTQAGYSAVSHFAGGLQEWRKQGYYTEGSGILPEDITPSGTFVVNTETSLVRWTGRNLFNHHRGTLRLSGGRLTVDAGVLKSASFTIDMNSIVCEDLEDSAYNAMLIRHLRDDDFFAVERFPSTEFVCEQAAPLPPQPPGTPNFTLHGSLTLRGVIQPLSFPAVIAAQDADHLTGQAQFEIDRTQFGCNYGSGRLFAFLGKHVVNDHIHLHVVLQAKRAE